MTDPLEEALTQYMWKSQERLTWNTEEKPYGNGATKQEGDTDNHNANVSAGI
jgi:hypothetical protein